MGEEVGRTTSFDFDLPPPTSHSSLSFLSLSFLLLCVCRSVWRPPQLVNDWARSSRECRRVLLPSPLDVPTRRSARLLPFLPSLYQSSRNLTVFSRTTLLWHQNILNCESLRRYFWRERGERGERSVGRMLNEEKEADLPFLPSAPTTRALRTRESIFLSPCNGPMVEELERRRDARRLSQVSLCLGFTSFLPQTNVEKPTSLTSFSSFPSSARTSR